MYFGIGVEGDFLNRDLELYPCDRQKFDLFHRITWRCVWSIQICWDTCYIMYPNQATNYNIAWHTGM